MNHKAKLLAVSIAFIVSGAANATDVFLGGGFKASTVETPSTLTAIGNEAFTGAFSTLDDSLLGLDLDLNPLVTVSNTGGLFNVNGLFAESFYGFDPVNVNIYGTSGLLASLSVVNGDYGAFHPEYSFSDVSYITYQSSFSLGLHLTTQGFSPVVSVPEPEAYAMLLAGMMMLGIARRRRPHLKK